MKKIRIAIMGCAGVARKSIIPAMKTLEQFEVVAIASRTLAKATEFAREFDCEAVEGYQALLEREDIEAVYIPLPTGLHDEWITRALLANKHVLAEKSFAENYASAEKMVKIAGERKLVVMEDFMFLYHSQHKFVKKLIEEGHIGELRVFRSSFGFPPFPGDNFRYSKDLGGGALLDAGAYTLRAAQLFMGNKVKVKAATLNSMGHGIDIYGGAYLENPEGIIGEVAFGFDNFYQCNYELWGSKGKITAERSFTPGPDFSPKIILEQQGNREEFLLEPDNHFKNILIEFHRAIANQDTEPKYSEVLNQARLLQSVMDLVS